MKNWLTLFLVSFSMILFAQNDTITLVSYNLLNFPDGRNDCGSGNVNLPNRSDSLRKIMQYLKPDILVACEIQHKDGADSVLTRSLNVFGATNYQMAPFMYSSGGGGGLNNAMYYNSDKLIFLRQKPILTDGRDMNHYTLMVKDPNISQHRDTIFIEVHMAHLKAGNGTSNAAQRASQTQTFRTYVDSKPLMRNHFFCGDYNVYTSSETCYQNLTTGGVNPFFDPIFSPGSWTSNASFAAIHTQSPRTSGGWACGAAGGMDDRFDQILVTQNVLSGQDNLNYVTNSYDAVGNDGLHYNSSLLSAPVNTQYPDSIINAIFYLSDHLPVALKLVPVLPTNNGLGLTYSTNGPLCEGNANGTATVTRLYGVAPYSIQWDANANNQTTATASNLLPGPYCVTVTDVNGLSDQVCFEIESIPGVTANIFPSGSTFLCDGQASVLVNGGAPPYVFLWDDPMGQTTQTAAALCPGTYMCAVSDQGGCEIQVSTTIALVSLLEQSKLDGKILVSPNPFLDELRIENAGEESLHVNTIFIRDIQGKTVLKMNINSLHKNTFISLKTNSLNTGLYFLELSNEESSTVFKIVK